MKRYLLLAFALVLCLTSPSQLRAQGGSNYSIFGIGDLRQTLGASYDGLAGTQIAVWSDYAINLANPAAWGAVKSTRIQGGFRFNQQSVSNGSITSDQNNGKLEGMATIFSIDTALGIGDEIEHELNFGDQFHFRFDAFDCLSRVEFGTK